MAMPDAIERSLTLWNARYQHMRNAGMAYEQPRPRKCRLPECEAVSAAEPEGYCVEHAANLRSWEQR